jgi:hypothetical protein
MRAFVVRLVPLAALLLVACTHAPREAATPATTTAPPTLEPAPAPVPPPSAFAPPGALSPRSASQVVHAAFGARVATLRTAVQLDAAGLKLVGVTASGMRVFTAAWDGERVTAERGPFVPKEVSPERVLADIQLALWPLESLQRAYAGSGRSVAEPFPGVRRLTRDGALVAEVHYASADPWNGRLWVVSFEYGYSLTIDTTPN